MTNNKDIFGAKFADFYIYGMIIKKEKGNITITPQKKPFGPYEDPRKMYIFEGEDPIITNYDIYKAIVTPYDVDVMREMGFDLSSYTCKCNVPGSDLDDAIDRAMKWFIDSEEFAKNKVTEMAAEMGELYHRFLANKPYPTIILKQIRPEND